ncbi:hypothetical protein V6767_22625, partial [Martelella sp. FLE1502]
AAYADDLYWNAGGTSGDGSSLVGYAGTWSTSVANWTNSANTNPAGPWVNQPGMNAFLTGQDQAFYITVTVDGTIQFDTITIGTVPPGQFAGDSVFYTITGGQFQMAPASGTHGTIVTYVPRGTVIDTIIYNSADNSVQDLVISDAAPSNPQFIGGMVILRGAQQYTGTTYVEAAFLQLGGAVLDIGPYEVGSVKGNIVLSPGSTLQIWSGTSDDSTVTTTNVISSKVASDTTTSLWISGWLTGGNHQVIFNSDSSAFLGAVQVGGIMSGTGAVGGVVDIVAGGEIHNTQGSTLKLGSSVTMHPGETDPFYGNVPGSKIVANLNDANAGQPIFSTGDLDIRSGLLTVNVSGSAQVYNIIQYTGTLQDVPNTMFLQAPTINGVTADHQLDVVTPGTGLYAPGMIRLLIYDANDEIAQYWNGGAPPPYTGGLVGGSGTWTSATQNWTDSTGTNASAWA